MATTPGRIRPWRYLAAFAGVVVVLYALVFFTGDGRPAPKLGIDLQGGTRVTLVARTVDGGAPPRDQLVQAQQIIEQRVNGLGVSGAEVVLDGNNITITVPGDAGEQARSLGQTAQLRFRPVIGQPVPAAPAPAPPMGATARTRRHPRPGATSAPAVPPTPAPTPQGAADPARQPVKPVAYSVPLQAPEPHAGPAAHAGPASPPRPRRPGRRRPPTPSSPRRSRPPRPSSRAPTRPPSRSRCRRWTAASPTRSRGYDDPALPLVTCNQDGTAKYLLGPSFLEGTQIASAQAATNGQGVGYVVNVTFKSAGRGHLGQVHHRAHRRSGRVHPRRPGRVRAHDPGRDLRLHRDLRPVQPGPGAEPRRDPALRVAAAVVRVERGADRLGHARAWRHWRPG